MKRWPADREMKVLVGGEDAKQRLLRRSALKGPFEDTLRKLGQTWSFTDNLDEADVFVALAQDGKAADPFTRKMLSKVYDGDAEKVAAAIPDVEEWESGIDVRMNMNAVVNFSFELTADNKVTPEDIPTLDLPTLFSTAKRIVLLKVEGDVPNLAFARVSAFTAVIGIEATERLSSCEGYTGLLSNGKGPSRQDLIALELIS
ncbi:MAG: hypothetical protein ACPGSI_13810 [Pikeienuella sp.]